MQWLTQKYIYIITKHSFFSFKIITDIEKSSRWQKSKNSIFFFVQLLTVKSTEHRSVKRLRETLQLGHVTTVPIHCSLFSANSVARLCFWNAWHPGDLSPQKRQKERFESGDKNVLLHPSCLKGCQHLAWALKQNYIDFPRARGPSIQGAIF